MSENAVSESTIDWQRNLRPAGWTDHEPGGTSLFAELGDGVVIHAEKCLDGRWLAYAHMNEFFHSGAYHATKDEAKTAAIRMGNELCKTPPPA